MSWMDDEIRKAIEQGKMSNLPGEGKPLRLDDDPHTPDEMRMAHKILKENGFAPDWMEEGKSIDERAEKLRGSIRRAIKAYRGALADATRSDQPARSRSRAEATWKLAREKLAEAATVLNREITAYNLKAPAGVAHKRYIDIEREINRLMQG